MMRKPKKKGKKRRASLKLYDQPELLPPDLSLHDIEELFQKCIRYSPEKFMRLWKNLGLTEDEGLQDMIPEGEFQAALYDIGFSMDSIQIHEYAAYVETRRWENSKNILQRKQSSKFHKFDLPTEEDASPEEEVSQYFEIRSITKSNLKDYLRQLRMVRVQSHEAWREEKKIHVRQEMDRKHSIFMNATNGKPHHLTPVKPFFQLHKIISSL